MKGSERVYSRGPSLGWLFARCCCCLPCRGEWLSALTPSFSRRLGRLNAREGWEKQRWVVGGRQTETVCCEPRLFRFPWQNSRGLALSLLGSDLPAEPQFGNCYLSAILDVRAPACRGVGCGCSGWGDGTRHSEPSVWPRSGRAAVPCSHLHMDLSCRINWWLLAIGMRLTLVSAPGTIFAKWQFSLGAGAGFSLPGFSQA